MISLRYYFSFLQDRFICMWLKCSQSLPVPSYIGMDVTVANGSNEQSYLRIWKPPKSKLGKEIIFV